MVAGVVYADVPPLEATRGVPEKWETRKLMLKSAPNRLVLRINGSCPYVLTPRLSYEFQRSALWVGTNILEFTLMSAGNPPIFSSGQK
jgi:hypothetical protein